MAYGRRGEWGISSYTPIGDDFELTSPNCERLDRICCMKDNSGWLYSYLLAGDVIRRRALSGDNDTLR